MLFYEPSQHEKRLPKGAKLTNGCRHDQTHHRPNRNPMPEDCDESEQEETKRSLGNSHSDNCEALANTWLHFLSVVSSWVGGSVSSASGVISPRDSPKQQK